MTFIYSILTDNKTKVNCVNNWRTELNYGFNIVHFKESLKFQKILPPSSGLRSKPSEKTKWRRRYAQIDFLLNPNFRGDIFLRKSGPLPDTQCCNTESVECKGFWRLCAALKIIKFMDFVHRPKL
jgi:hypothetical protein